MCDVAHRPRFEALCVSMFVNETQRIVIPAQNRFSMEAASANGLVL